MPKIDDVIGEAIVIKHILQDCSGEAAAIIIYIEVRRKILCTNTVLMKLMPINHRILL